MDDFDKILGVDNNSVFDPPKTEIKKETPIKEEVKIIDKPLDSSPCLSGTDFPEQYTIMVKRLLKQYKQLPNVNYIKIYAELSDLSIKSKPTPTLQDFNDEIQRVQAAKERLSEIFVITLRHHTIKSRITDLLKDAWGVFSTENSADKRKADALFRLNEFEEDFAEVEALLKACFHVLKTLDSLHESLYRRITVTQMQLKLHDFGRSALPDNDFSSTNNVIDEKSLFSDKDTEEKNTKNLKAEERTF